MKEYDFDKLMEFGLDQKDNKPELKSPWGQCCVTSVCSGLYALCGSRLLEKFKPNEFEAYLLNVMDDFGHCAYVDFINDLGWPDQPMTRSLFTWASGDSRLVSTIAAYCAVQLVQNDLGLEIVPPDFEQTRVKHRGGETWYNANGRPFLTERYDTMTADELRAHFFALAEGPVNSVLGRTGAIMITMIKNTDSGHYNCVSRISNEGMHLKDPFGRHNLSKGWFLEPLPAGPYGTSCFDSWEDLASAHGSPQSRALIIEAV